MAGTRAPQELEPETERILPPQARVVPVRAVQQEVRSAVSEQQKAAERVVGMTAELFGNTISESKDPTLKGAVRNSQLNTLLEMVKS